jgi:protein tyrosine/serine phosphatase
MPAASLAHRAVRAGALAAGLLLGLVVLAYLLARDRDNFHVVVPGELCRSGQMEPDALRAALAREGVRTVVNLRGHQDGAGWYEQESAILAAAGVRLVDFPMSSGVVLSGEKMDELVSHLRRGPAPVLVHCRAGADRAGLAAGLYLASTGRSPEEARGQLSWRYGHFPYAWWRERGAMDESLEAYLARPPTAR